MRKNALFFCIVILLTLIEFKLISISTVHRCSEKILDFFIYVLQIIQKFLP